MWFLTQFNCFHNPDSWFQKLWEQTQYLHFKVPTFTTVWANYNGVVLHISRKKYGCFDSRKLITDLQNTPLIHSTLLVLHALFYWYADLLSANLYLQFTYPFLWASFILYKPDLYIHLKQANLLDELWFQQARRSTWHFCHTWQNLGDRKEHTNCWSIL